MTELEHAIQHIKTRADAWAVKEVTEALRSISERLDKALSQEPCDDAISREAVDKYIVNLLKGYLYDEERERLENFSAYLWELPSVTPKATECEDTISRKDVMDWLENATYEDVCEAIGTNLDFLPPVIPKPETVTEFADRFRECGKMKKSQNVISREAVEEIVNDIRDCISVEGYCAILERLRKLPPVTPSRKE